MAAAPPPFSPYDQKRQMRDYARAQRDAAKAQRYYWRAMRRPSLAGPIILLTIGIIALLLETGHLDRGRFWEFYGQWWPLVMIGVGVISLAEWYLDRDKPYVRRSAGGIVWLLILLAVIGFSARGVHHLGQRFGDNDDFFSFMGEEHDNNVELNQALPENATVEIQNPRGDVTITPSTDGQMHVRTHQVARSNSDREVQRTFAAEAPKVSGGGSSFLLRVDGSRNGRADLTVELPVSTTTNVTAGRGEVTIEGLKSPASVTAKRGDVKFNDMGAAVHAHMSKGDFSAHGVTGDLGIDGATGDVTISEIKGKVNLEGDFFGDTHVEQIASAFHFHSSRTEIDVAKLDGDLTMDSDDLHITQAAGPVRIQARSKNIDCTQCSGDVQIQNTNGEVTVAAAAPVGSIRITNENEPITVSLPPGAGFSVEASTNDGDIETDYSLPIEGNEQRHSLNGKVGNGNAKIELRAGHGDIHVRKGELMPAAPRTPRIAPEPPAPPAKPGKPAEARHLRVPKDAPAEKPTVQ